MATKNVNEWIQRARRAPAATGLVVVLVLMFLATSLDTDERLLVALGKVNERILAGEVWRLVTASFVHLNVLHLFVNASSLAALGPFVERLFGKARFLVIFVLGGAMGMLASVVWTPPPSLGASAGLFALVGALITTAARSRREMSSTARRLVLRQSSTIVLLNLALGFILVGFIDNAAHIGGLVGGLALGLVLQPRAAVLSEWNRHAVAVSKTPKGRTHLGWAGQRWRAVASWLALPLACVPVVVPHTMIAVGLLGIPLAVICFGVWCLARCPRCRALVVWEAISKESLGAGSRRTARGTSCPYCGYPDTPAPATVAQNERAAAGSLPRAS